jgi:hypothetical protein
MSDATEEELYAVYAPRPVDRLAFFRQQFFPIAVVSMLMQHRDGLALGLVNLAIAALVVVIVSLALSVIRRAKP